MYPPPPGCNPLTTQDESLPGQHLVAQAHDPSAANPDSAENKAESKTMATNLGSDILTSFLCATTPKKAHSLCEAPQKRSFFSLSFLPRPFPVVDWRLKWREVTEASSNAVFFTVGRTRENKRRTELPNANEFFQSQTNKHKCIVQGL